MKQNVGGLTLLSILLAIPLSAETSRIWIPNSDSKTISIIDPATNKVVQTITSIAKPYSVVFSPDGNRAYITNQSSCQYGGGDARDKYDCSGSARPTLDVMDLKTEKIIAQVPLSGPPSLSTITKDGRRVLICIKAYPPQSGVDIVDTTSLERVKTLPMIGSMHDIFMTADGKYAVAGASDAGFKQPTYPLVVIDLKTEQIAWESRTKDGVLTFAIESGPDGSGRRIFVEHAGLHGFAVVDFESRKEVARIKFPDPLKFSFEGGLDVSPTHGTAITPDGRTLWVSSRGTNNVYLYGLPELKLVGQVYMPELEVPGKPVQGGDAHWITFTPDGKTAYLPMSEMGVVAAVDVKTLKVVARIPVGLNPRRSITQVLP